MLTIEDSMLLLLRIGPLYLLLVRYLTSLNVQRYLQRQTLRIQLFRLSNAPTTFQTYINQALVRLVDVTYVVYLNDILIFLEDPREYIEAVCQVLKRLRTYKLFVNPKKYTFRTNTVEFLGFLIGLKDIEIDLSQVKVI